MVVPLLQQVAHRQPSPNPVIPQSARFDTCLFMSRGEAGNTAGCGENATHSQCHMQPSLLPPGLFFAPTPAPSFSLPPSLPLSLSFSLCEHALCPPRPSSARGRVVLYWTLSVDPPLANTMVQTLRLLGGWIGRMGALAPQSLRCRQSVFLLLVPLAVDLSVTLIGGRPAHPSHSARTHAEAQTLSPGGARSSAYAVRRVGRGRGLSPLNYCVSPPSALFAAAGRTIRQASRRNEACIIVRGT